jgi:glutamate 5-kinase
MHCKRIVIKLGSSFLFGDKAVHSAIEEIARQVSLLIKEGKEIILVSSGAIASGMQILKVKSRPRELACLQALASLGQHVLMGRYQEAFALHGLHCAQVLLTWDDFFNRKRCLNAKHTLEELLRLGCVPIINENDTISCDEIKFGDNDRLSALVASNLASADMLIILSDVEGLLGADKKIIRVVSSITPQIKRMACPTDKHTCVGGMVTKIDAVKTAVGSGIPCVIANGRSKGVILNVIREPEKNGTLFLPKKTLSQRQRWLAFGARPKGKIIVDSGARIALNNKKSLLSVGVVGCEGAFACGDIVSLLDTRGNEFARGKACISQPKLDKVKGKHSTKEVIHCDNIVIL